jgi:hypothetical protein
MVSRRVWLAGLGTALIGPYLAYEGKLPHLLQSTAQQTSGSYANWLGETQTPDLAETPNDFNAPLVPLYEALRTDASPQWVVSRWPRVATVVGELEWSGMRVPLLTGKEPGDLVGSLTYYFDGGQKLRRISLEGYTGDERTLVALAMQNFGLQPEGSLSGGLYVSRWNRQVMSALAVQYAPVVHADSPHRRHVMLEVNLPAPGWRLSAEMNGLLAAG